MRFVNCSISEEQQNVRAVKLNGEIYYQTCVEIPKDEELLVWYSDVYVGELGLLSNQLVHLSDEMLVLDAVNTGWSF